MYQQGASQPYERAYPDIVNKMPKSDLGYASNNVFPNFPPLMTDGRSAVSSWNTETVMNAHLKEQNGIPSNWEYRRFLTANAKTLMENNFNQTANDTGYSFISKEIQNQQTTSNQPALYYGLSDNTVHMGFQDSDLKREYLTREQLQAKKVTPTIRITGNP